MISRPTRLSRPGFTMAELLIVIGILALLASIAVVVASKARKSANKTQLAFQIQTISVGLEAYKTDFNGYPITTVADSTQAGQVEINRDGVRGARTLCKALMAPTGQGDVLGTTGSYTFDLTRAHQDGAEGLGFRIQPRSGLFSFDGTKTPVEIAGKVYGPYLAADKFKLSRTNDDGTLLAADYMPGKEKYDDTAVILDANDKPILYYPAQNTQAPIQIQYAYLSNGHSTTDVTSTFEPFGSDKYQGTSMYVSNDNSCWLAPPTMRIILGDTNGDDRIAGTETPPIRGKYILWCAGPDGVFGPRQQDGRPSTPQTIDEDLRKLRLDDVTNFQGE